MDIPHTQGNDSTDTKDSQIEMLSEAQIILRTLLKLHAEDGEQDKIERNIANLYKLLGVKKDSSSAQPSTSDDSLYIPSGAVDYLAQIDKRKETKTVGTSLADLDQVLGGGLEPKRLMVLLGAPGGGKTTLANQIAWSAAQDGRPVLFVSSEEQPFSLLSKTLARVGKIPYTAVLKGHEEWMAKIKETLQQYQQTPAATRLAYMDITMGGSLETIESGAEKLFEQFKSDGNGILVIDYLQNVARQLISSRRSATMDVRLAVTEISARLRAIASSLDCTVIALASQHREAYKANDASRNSLSSGKESGDIEYTADVVMSIVDGSTSERMAPSGFTAKVLRVDKNRQGAAGDTCAIDLDWSGQYQQFTQAYSYTDDQETVLEDIGPKNGKKAGSK